MRSAEGQEENVAKARLTDYSRRRFSGNYTYEAMVSSQTNCLR